MHVKSLKSHKLLYICLSAGGGIILILLLYTYIDPSWIPNYLGVSLYGLRLPEKITYAGRNYSKGNGKCLTAAALQTEYLAKDHISSLKSEGYVWNFIGSRYEILSDASIKSPYQTTLVFIKVNTCYIVYTLRGGP